MALLTPPPAAPQRGDRTTFANRVDAFITWLINFVTELVALVANLNSIAAGGAYSIPYIVNGAGPGGALNFNGGSGQSSATSLSFDFIGADGANHQATISKFTSSTSAIKGQIKVQKVGDPSKWAIFDVSGNSSGSYAVINVIGVDASSASPFVTGDAIMLFFQRTGDKGDVGTGYLTLLGQATVSSTVANVDFLSICTSAYDKYLIEIEGLQSDSAGNLALTLANGGVVDTAANYYNWAANATNISTTAVNRFTGASVGSSGVTSGTVTIELRNTNSASKMKSVGVRGVLNLSAVLVEGAYAGGVVSGFRLSLPTSNIAAGTIRVYGFKNT